MNRVTKIQISKNFAIEIEITRMTYLTPSARHGNNNPVSIEETKSYPITKPFENLATAQREFQKIMHNDPEYVVTLGSQSDHLHRKVADLEKDVVRLIAESEYDEAIATK